MSAAVSAGRGPERAAASARVGAAAGEGARATSLLVSGSARVKASVATIRSGSKRSEAIISANSHASQTHSDCDGGAS